MNGKKLKQLRKKAGVSQKLLAARLFMHYATISGYENGRPIPKSIQVDIREALSSEKYQVIRKHRDPEKFTKLTNKRIEVIERIDKRVYNWSELAEDDEDLILLRKLYNVKQDVIEEQEENDDQKDHPYGYVPNMFYTK